MCLGCFIKMREAVAAMRLRKSIACFEEYPGGKGKEYLQSMTSMQADEQPAACV